MALHTGREPIRSLVLAFAVLLPAAPAVAAARAEAFFLAASSARQNGHPTDDAWRLATATSGFVQRDPHEGAAPSQSTEFRVAYDATTLFIQVRAFDREPERIVTYLTRRDDQSPCDWIRVFIDSFHDRRTAYEFAVNPSGVKQDRYWYDDTNNDDSWDAIWDVTVARDGSGWSVQFQIPLSQLRFRNGSFETVGFAVVREIGRLNEVSSWPLLARSAPGYVSSFGELGGLKITGTPKRLELMPYAVADLTRQPTGGNPPLRHSSSGVTAGLDLRYRLTPGLMLTATVNPDFGQVEADPAVVNLSSFETFFPERRPFFIEGSGAFRFDADCYDACANLFYSRRIGRQPQGTSRLFAPEGSYVDTPAQTTILGAAKVTGRMGPYAIGAMYAATTAESAAVLSGGALSRANVEPSTSYTIARVRRELANQSYVGFIVTATNRRLPAGPNFLPASAYAGGVDFEWRFLERYSLKGFWEGSRVNGTPQAIEIVQTSSRHNFQRPDLASARLDPTRTSLAGGSAAIGFSKIGGTRTRFNTNVMFRTPGFDTNDLGFLQRADLRSMGNWFQVRSDVPNRWFRTRTVNFNYWGNWNADGDRLSSGGNVNANARLSNNWFGGAGVGFQRFGFDDRVARGGPAVRWEGLREAWFWIYSDDRRRVQLGVEGNAGGDGRGSSFRSIQPSVTVRPVPPVMFSVGVPIRRNMADSQWVNNVTDSIERFVFGRLDQTTVSFTGRLNYTMSPNLSLQLYAEPFVSGGHYDRFKELVDGRNPDYAARYAPFDYLRNPDFNVKSFRTTNVLRWEYRPGSTLFVVWQQSRENNDVRDGLQVGRDFRDIFAVPPYNTFLVKLTYWLNY